MNVLYVNHTATIGGGERSLLLLLGALPHEVRPLVATPRGPLAQAVERLGVPATPITGTAGSLRPHPLHTPRALAELGIAAACGARPTATAPICCTRTRSARASCSVSQGGRRPGSYTFATACPRAC